MKIRKALTASLASVILAGSCITPAAALTPVITYGDVNLDTVVDVSDAVMIARFYVQDFSLQITDVGKMQADVNLDRNSDIDDMTCVLEYIAHKRTALGIPEQKIEPKYQAENLTDGVTADNTSAKAADEAFIASQMKLTAGLFSGAALDPQTTDNMLISPLSIS